MRRFWLVAILSIGVAVPVLMPAQTAGRAEVLLEAAKKKELVSGDLEAAIREYRDIVAKYPANRAVAAESLVRMGQCYEKLGDAQAKSAYQRVVREFGDQKQYLEEAQRRLARLGSGAPSSGSVTLSQERIWSNVGGNLNLTVSPDGSFAVYANGKGDLRYRDLASGTERAITADAQTSAPAFSFAFHPRISPDGKLVAYLLALGPVGPGGLRIIGIDGSGMREFEDGTGSPLAWSPDGKIIMLRKLAGFSTGEIALIPAAGGARTVLGTGLGIGATQNAFSPDGRFVVYTFRKAPRKARMRFGS